MSQLSLKYFFDYKFLHASENFITIPDGSKVRVKHIGTVRLNDNILLHNVLHVPKFNFNLIYVYKLCKDMHSDFSVAFHS